MSALTKLDALIDDYAGTPGDLIDIRAAVAELIEAQRGCRDMLREASKQFRLSGDNGHARHCDALADKANRALARIGGVA